jgi:phage gpG-like protein
MKLIHQEVAGPVAAEAKRRVRKKSGRLQRSIRPSSTTTMARVQAGAGVVYAGVQHFGWPGHNIEANPFLTDAIQDKQMETLTLYEQKLSAWIDAVWEDTR